MRAPSYPVSRVSDEADLLWGQTVADPYRWLEDGGAPEVVGWMGAQDTLAREMLGAIPERDTIAKRLTELLYVDTISAPSRRGSRFFYTRTHADREKQVYYWKGADEIEHVLLDPNTLSLDGSVSVGLVAPSWDGELVAFSLHRNNADEATLYLMDVTTGSTRRSDVLEGAKYAFPVWTPDNVGFYYTYLPVDPAIAADERPGWADVRYHRVGLAQLEDVIVHEKLGDPTQFVGVDLSRDGRWLFFYVQHGWNATDLYLRDLQAAESNWTPWLVGLEAQFNVSTWKDCFYIVTNDGAPNWRVFDAPAGPTPRAEWREIVAERSDAVIEGGQIVGARLALSYLKNATSLLEVRELDGTFVREIPLPGIGATEGMTGLPEDDEAYFSFQSFTLAPQIFRTSIASGETELWASAKVPFDPSPYEVEQVEFPSRDGTRLTMFVVRRKDAPLDGSTPFILYGYGGFNVSMRPTFRASLYAWLETGGGYAVANLRGGGEYGEAWHQAGMREKKQNVFDDFIAASETLIERGYSSPARLSIYGGSNGGLLVGAALVQRPELFAGAVCAVPLLDMVRYHKFGSGRTWIPEYGSVDESQPLFEAILAYSPYHHVRAGAPYPPTLFLSADSDDRVDPLHARKMVAALQAANPDGAPILLRIERNAGHGGADMVKLTIEKMADTYAFLLAATRPERE